MTTIYSFEPIEDKHARILILGSIPGQASLTANQYYAHAQNTFWRIMAELLQLNPASTYEEKTQALKSAHIALWDVLQSCKRMGSLDSMIESDAQIANDFPTFFHCHKQITHIFFNGAKAEACFKQHVLAKINADSIHLLRLPSTSPAHATLSYERKLAIWKQELGTRNLINNSNGLTHDAT
tara:strand:+ start:11323 stop:11868 length:546 start_codon:yes stop_codon:yes gene_type:complete